ncbi:MAG: hypothetical protein HGA45_44250, partial [Chloroflexales bacterium]|nr:hypothetical protein [Chloroflexales bacterium]
TNPNPMSGFYSLAIMNADGSGVRNLTPDDESFELRPDFSPDGTQIVFDRDVSGGSAIWAIAPDGSNARQLSPTASTRGERSWSPVSGRASRRTPLSPARARALLRATGSAQQDHPERPATQRIGNRPDLRQLIPAALETNMWVRTHFTGSVTGGQTRRYFAPQWPAHWHVVWTIAPTTVSSPPGAPQLQLSVRTERSSDSFVTYWLDIANLSSGTVEFEARYAVLGW